MSKFVLRSLASIIVFTFLLSCENEVSEIGTDVINSIEAQPPYVTENVIAYSEKHNSIQTNGLSNYLLGKYDDPYYGSTDVKILSQVSLSQTNPDFGVDPIVDSVVMTLPFFSRQVEDGEYVLDSVYGEGSFKLSVFQSNQFLRELDPGSEGEFEDRQLYYTNQLDEFRSNIESTPIVTSDTIKPSELTKPVILEETQTNGDLDTLRLSPRIRVKMPVQYFEEKILNPSNPEVLASNNAFKNYLRGFLMEAEQLETESSSMSLFDLQNQDAKITIYYKNESEEVNEEGVTTTETTYNQFDINFNGIKLNLYENNMNIDLSTQDKVQGEENIYLKGGEGSSGIIELFTGPDLDENGFSDELDELRSNNWLINEASIDLYINKEEAPSPKNRINRVFLFNLDDEEVLEDFTRDPTASENPNRSRRVHLGLLREDDNGDLFYRIRLTSHINDVINNGASNVRLGLFVTSNVNNPNLIESRNPGLDITKRVPAAMLETPRGIVIHGNQSANEAKKLKLRIIYTETN